jgi:hypothetical protein
VEVEVVPMIVVAADVIVDTRNADMIAAENVKAPILAKKLNFMKSFEYPFKLKCTNPSA